MIWKKLSIGKKLFIAMMTTVTVVIAFVAFLITLSMRSGFENYVLQAELDRFQPVIKALEASYDASAPGWPELRDDRRSFNRLIREVVPPEASNNGAPPPRPNAGPRPGQGNEQRAGDRRNLDPLGINSRFALLDENKNHIVGARFSISNDLLREIRIQIPGEKTLVAGFVAMKRPGRVVGDPSNLFLIDQLKSLGLTLILALVLSGLAAYLLARQFTRPVNHLMSGTQRLAAGEYDLRLEKTSEDEFGHLVEQFNILAAQLAEQEKTERRWMSDTSHELQTPLAVLRAEIEALQDGVRKADEKTLATLHMSVTRLSALVRDISLLSNAQERGNNGSGSRMAQNRSLVNLSELAKDAVSKAEGLAEKRGLKITTELKNELVAECDTMRIGQLIDNILTNSIRYTEGPGEIKMSSAREGDMAVIRVDDSNSPPPADAMDKLFDRFYRADQSRTREDGSVGGSGLGLSICKLIAEAHNGSLTAELSPMGGLAMIVRLPLKKNDAKEGAI